MNEQSLEFNQLDNYTSPQLKSKRLDCSICNYHIDPNDETAFATFHCNVRTYKDETFKVWRCPRCQTIHCLDVVDLPHYYKHYPIAQAKLSLPYRICYQSLERQLTKHRFSKNHLFLDYGCAGGLFIKYLQERGFTNCSGYDPYAPQDGLGNLATLRNKQFDYILLQDVIEHVEDPNILLSQLNDLLAPGGYILIGTPDAANLDLSKPNVPDYYTQIHVPYHIHIYTSKILESLGRRQGWEFVDFFDHQYHDTTWFSVNTRAWNQYVHLFDGSLDVLYEPIKPLKALTSYKYMFYAIFGYWLSYRTGMAAMFRKT